jgi:hypothetical protein
LKTANRIRYNTTSAINIPMNIFLFLVRVFVIMGDNNTGSGGGNIGPGNAPEPGAKALHRGWWRCQW